MTTFLEFYEYTGLRDEQHESYSFIDFSKNTF